MADQTEEDFDADSFLRLGFSIRGFNNYDKIKEAGQIEYFRALYGTSPIVLAIIWKQLQNGLKVNGMRPIHLLLLYRWLRSYETEKEL